MFPGPGHPLGRGMATAASPTLFRIAAAALAEHARERPAQILAERQRDRQAAGDEHEQRQREPSAQRKAQAKPGTLGEAGLHCGRYSVSEYIPSLIPPQSKKSAAAGLCSRPRFKGESPLSV